MKKLLHKNQENFIICIIIITICSAPIFFFTTKFFYTKDLDELIEYRSDEFQKIHLPQLTLNDIEMWNKYNEDIQIIPYTQAHTLDKNLNELHFNKAEGYSIDYRIIYRRIKIENQPYILSSQIPMIENYDLVGMIGTQYGILILITLFTFFFVQNVLSKKLWKPFYGTLENIKKFNLEQDTVPELPKTSIKEFIQLNEILNELISDNLKTYKQQKEFIENASHELQTPLAVFQSQLDILLQQSDLTEAQVNIIQSLYSVSSRLTRLNKNLLLLAKIDNAQFKEIQEINVSQLLETLMSYLKELAKDTNIILSIEHPLIINGNKILLESLINNLIMNAIKHNMKNGTITVTLKGETLSIRNTSEQQPLDPDKIFRRFNRSSEKKKGNGLGLAIASQICKMHNWNISYTYENDSHCFQVNFHSTSRSY